MENSKTGFESSNKPGIDNELLAELIAEIKGYVWLADFSTGEKKMSFSESVEKITGYSAAEINNLPGNIFSLVFEDDRINIQDQQNDLVASVDENEATFVYRLVNREKHLLWIKEDIVVSRNDSGSVTKLTGLVTDITKLKEREQKIENACSSLRDLNSAKDKFISIISHDLRAPFTSLLGFSEILMNEQDLPENDRNEYVGYIYEASNSQLQLINYLLDWSRLQTGRIQIEPQGMLLKGIVTTCISSLTGAAMRKNIEIHTDIPPEIEVNADPRMFNQVISNLLGNAIKFTPDGKNIFVSAGKFKEGMIEIVVKDEGVGILPEHQSKIFRIDQKISTEGTAGERGTGFGLTLVKEIVEKHGGNIWFYSERDKGSEFHITIPEAQNIVLLVEDDEDVRKLYSKLVKKALPDYEIVEATNGYEAMSFILKKMPSLVITDHEMPLMSGMHLAEAVRKKDKDSRIPIIVISAKLSGELKADYEKYNINHFINKPVESNVLIQTIKETIF